MSLGKNNYYHRSLNYLINFRYCKIWVNPYNFLLISKINIQKMSDNVSYPTQFHTTQGHENIYYQVAIK